MMPPTPMTGSRPPVSRWTKATTSRARAVSGRPDSPPACAAAARSAGREPVAGQGGVGGDHPGRAPGQADLQQLGDRRLGQVRGDLHQHAACVPQPGRASSASRCARSCSARRPGRVRRADVDREVVAVRDAAPGSEVEVVLDRLVQRGHLGLAEADAQRHPERAGAARASRAARAAAPALLKPIRLITASLSRQPEQPGPVVARLGVRGDRADLDEAEARAPARPAAPRRSCPCRRPARPGWGSRTPNTVRGRRRRPAARQRRRRQRGQPPQRPLVRRLGVATAEPEQDVRTRAHALRRRRRRTPEQRRPQPPVSRSYDHGGPRSRGVLAAERGVQLLQRAHRHLAADAAPRCPSPPPPRPARW